MMDEVIKIGRLSCESASIKDGTYSRAIKGGFLTDNGVVTPAAIRRVEWNNTMTLNEEELNQLRKSSSAHPNILRYLSYELQDNFLFIATEWCTRTLEEHANIDKKSKKRLKFMNQGANNPEEQLIDRELNERTILRHITEGLAYLHHRSKVVHGNIKPSNILIFKDEEKWSVPLVKLADDSEFCRIFKKENNTAASAKISWKAPESYDSFAGGQIADIFSLGCIFGFVLSKKWEHPFGENSLLRLTSSSQLKGFYDDDGPTLNFIQTMVDGPKKRPSLTNILENAFWNKNVLPSNEIQLNKSTDDILNEPFALYNHLTYLHYSLERSDKLSDLHLNPDNADWIKVGKMAYNMNNSIGSGSRETKVYSGLLIRNNSGVVEVAVKRISKGDLLSKDEQLLPQMCDILTTIEHPNILQYLHTEKDTSFIYLVTEKCECTLNNYRTGIHLDEKDILRQVTSGLSHLHGLTEPIIHRDIKPENILVFQPKGGTQKPLIKLADFGISRILKEGLDKLKKTTTTNPHGTSGWIAPEFFNISHYGPESDIFPLGLIFGYLLSQKRKHPFEKDGEGPDDRSVRIQKQEPMIMKKTDLKQVYAEDEDAFDLILWMLKMDPSERPSAEQVLKHKFFS